MATPLWDLLRQLSAEQPLRMDMPGHHGEPLPMGFPWPVELDYTENGRTGNLYDNDPDAIQAAEALWAARFGMDQCLFLTGGSTQGIHAGLTLLAAPDSTIALDRGSHRSAYTGMGLLDLHPVYLSRPWLTDLQVCGATQPDDVADVLRQHPEIQTVCITSPSYYGVLSDIPAIAAVCHQAGTRLMVDAAHGAHLPFLGYRGFEAADVVVMSAHKTLCAPGQTALLFANGISGDAMRRAASMHGTSSPSYVMMAALDAVRAYMEGPGAAQYQQTVQLVSDLRSRWPSLHDLPALQLDPTRLTLLQRDGYAMAERLRQQGIYAELSDTGHVVLILTSVDTPKHIQRLEKALSKETWLAPEPCPPAPEPPQAVCSARDALFAPWERVPLAQAAGRIAASPIAPYPPGVPVVAPGEEISKKSLAYLAQIGYNETMADVVCQSFAERVPSDAD